MTSKVVKMTKERPSRSHSRRKGAFVFGNIANIFGYCQYPHKTVCFFVFPQNIANIRQYYCGTYFAVCFAFWLLQIRRIGPIWSQYCQNIAIFEIGVFCQYWKILPLSSSAMIRQIRGTEVFCRHFSLQSTCLDHCQSEDNCFHEFDRDQSSNEEKKVEQLCNIAALIQVSSSLLSAKPIGMIIWGKMW